jgi:hypothetical protein
VARSVGIGASQIKAGDVGATGSEAKSGGSSDASRARRTGYESDLAGKTSRPRRAICGRVISGCASHVCDVTRSRAFRHGPRGVVREPPGGSL